MTHKQHLLQLERDVCAFVWVHEFSWRACVRKEKKKEGINAAVMSCVCLHTCVVEEATQRAALLSARLEGRTNMV